MKVNLISFQDKAVKDLRVDISDALDVPIKNFFDFRE